MIPVDRVGQVERRKRIEILPGNLPKFRLDILEVGIPPVCLNRIQQGGQNRKPRALSAVVSPNRNQNIFDVVLDTALHRGFRCSERKSVARRKPLPSPGTARKPDGTVEFLVKVQHVVVCSLIRMVVIPVDELEVLGYFRDNFVGNFDFFLRIVLASIGDSEEHVTPY